MKFITKQLAIALGLRLCIAIISFTAQGQTENRRNSLLNIAHPVYKCSKFQFDYRWVDDHTISFLDKTSTGAQIKFVDLNTKLESRTRVIPGIPAWKCYEDHYCMCNYGLGDISYDYRWGVGYGEQNMHIYSLDGKQRYNLKPYSHIAWLHKDNMFVSVAGNSHKSTLVIHKLTGEILNKIDLNQSYEVLGVTPDDHVLLYRYPEKSEELVDVDLFASPVRIVKYETPIASFGTVISPNGKKVLYVSTDEKPLIMPLIRHAPILKDKNPNNRKIVQSIYVSNLDGKNTKYIGSVESAEPILPAVGYFNPKNIRGTTHWKPDGKSISFVYDHQLYAIDVPDK